MSNKMLLGVGAAGAVAAIGVAMVGKIAIGAAKEYQSSTAQMAAQADISTAKAKQIGNAFLNTAGQSTFSAQQMMDALAPVSGQLELITGHALTTADATKVMSASQDLAEASGTDLTTSTAALTNVMRTFGMNVGQSGQAANSLFEASRITNQGVGTLAQGLDRLHARLGPLAPSLSDTAALLASPAFSALGSRGLLTASTAMTTLLGGSKAVNKEIASLGIRVKDSNGNFVGMASLIGQLQPKLAHMGTAQQALAEKTLFGAGAAGMMGSVISGGLPAWQKATELINKHNGVSDAAAKRSATLEGEQKKLKAAVADGTTAIGQGLLPVVTKIATAILPVVTAIMGWVTHHQKLTAIILIGIGALGALVAIIAIVGMVVAALASPIVGIVVGIIALIAVIVLLVTHWRQVVHWVDTVGGRIPVLGGILHALLAPIQAVIDLVKTLRDHWSQIVDVFQQVANAAGNVGSALSKMPVVGGLISAIGHRAAGGPVSAGMPYIVGETGQELFIPSQPGTIVPHPGLTNAQHVPASAGATGGDDSANLVAIVQLLRQLVGNTQPAAQSTGLGAQLQAVMTGVGWARQRGYSSAVPQGY